jgi:hypothetical protein
VFARVERRDANNLFPYDCCGVPNHVVGNGTGVEKDLWSNENPGS